MMGLVIKGLGDLAASFAVASPSYLYAYFLLFQGGR